MRSMLGWALAAGMTAAAFVGCGDDSSDGGETPGGTGGTSSAGSGGTSTGGSSTGGQAGSSTGGSAGTAGGGGTAGAAGAAGSGGSAGDGGSAGGGGDAGSAGTAGGGGGTSFWPNDYQTCTGTSSHKAGSACLGCHSNILFGGTVYSGGSGVAGVEIGVKSGDQFLTACSASNGNFYLKSSSTVDWATAEIHIRNANGDSSLHPPSVGNGDCNSCHTGSTKLLAP